MSCLKLYLLGPPRAERTDGPCPFDRRKAMALLAYLAVTARRHPRDTLATLFWPELDQSRARAALRRTLAAVKQGIGEGWLDVDREAIGLNDDRPIWTDIGRFHECLSAAEAHDHPQDGLCSSCLAVLSEAAALYRDEFMAGFTLRDSPDFDDWQREQGELARRELAIVLEALSRSWRAKKGGMRHGSLPPISYSSPRLRNPKEGTCSNGSKSSQLGSRRNEQRPSSKCVVPGRWKRCARWHCWKEGTEPLEKAEKAKMDKGYV